MGSLDGWSSARSFRKSAAAVKATTNRAECVSGAPLRHSSARAMSSIAIASPIASVDAAAGVRAERAASHREREGLQRRRISTPASAAGNETPASANPAPNAAAASAAAVTRAAGATQRAGGAAGERVHLHRQLAPIVRAGHERGGARDRENQTRAGARRHRNLDVLVRIGRDAAGPRHVVDGQVHRRLSDPLRPGCLEIAARTSTVSCG